MRSDAWFPQLSHHWEHCFDYLRQALTCNADATLESLQKSGDRLLVSMYGACKSWNALCDWAERKKPTDDSGINSLIKIPIWANDKAAKDSFNNTPFPPLGSEFGIAFNRWTVYAWPPTL